MALYIAIVPLMDTESAMLNALNIGADDGRKTPPLTEKGKTMREKLIDVFMHLDRHISNRDEYGICFTSDFVKAVEDVLVMLKNQDANGVTVQKWIPASKPPNRKDADKYGRVLAMEMGMMALINYKGPINYPDRFPYWMPLPQPPKEKQ
jgi:hypothetical protein